MSVRCPDCHSLEYSIIESNIDLNNVQELMNHKSGIFKLKCSKDGKIWTVET